MKTRRHREQGCINHPVVGRRIDHIVVEVDTDGKEDRRELEEGAGIVLQAADLGQMQTDLLGGRNLIVEGDHFSPRRAHLIKRRFRLSHTGERPSRQG